MRKRIRQWVWKNRGFLVLVTIGILAGLLRDATGIPVAEPHFDKAKAIFCGVCLLIGIAFLVGLYIWQSRRIPKLPR